ncbi:DNA polymerase Y family protein [Caulobacter segnis]|uniref:Y-family DNA polymerase n=1 Tax=Caulobacter segnis TaxID=88688 RepID=UPI00240EBD0F|nr:DNA polymerase Y family protein [Caulobacter segnis]MDG2523692.1 DNA polymerase Y family protein [Caulobacter segnis]
MPRILSLWCPNWPITTWRRKNAAGLDLSSPAKRGRGEEKPRPLVLIQSEAGTRKLAAVDRTAVSLGLFAGQKAADAAALVPELDSVDYDPDGDAAALEALCDWCVRFSPAVAVDGLDGLFLDITGVSHLWDGEAAMASDLIARLAANAIPARAAVADTAGAAWALARFGRARVVTVPPGKQADALRPLPIAALRLDEAAAAQLPRLGLTRVGKIMDQPRAALARRFGMGLMLRLDQALGGLEEALAFRRPPTPWFERLAFAEPISALEDLERVTDDILAAMAQRLAARGQGARRFILTFHRLDGRAFTVSAGLSRLGRAAAPVARLLKPKLGEVDPGFGIEVATLCAEEVETLSERQSRLDDDAEALAQEGVAALVDRLTARLGEGRVFRAIPVQSHVPERAVRRGEALSDLTEGWDPDKPRPVRLFRQPEPIEAMALLPDNPPSRFQWRGRMHTVTRAEGPERIGDEWWRRPLDQVGSDWVRDYYRVEDTAGARFWIFRAGLYGGETKPRWWLHGLFA